jgi:AraC-like ligand binding domain
VSGQALSAAVAVGTAASSSLEVGCFDVSDVYFGPYRRIDRHAHPRACVAVVLGGAVRKQFDGLTIDATEGSVVTMPALEPHDDLFGRSGTRILVVENDLVKARTCFRNSRTTLIAIRAVQELELRDEFTPLALEGLALELVALAGRGEKPAQVSHWLQEAHDELCNRFRDPPTTAELATRLGFTQHI